MAQGGVLGTCCAAPILWGHGACQLRREAALGRAKGWLLGAVTCWGQGSSGVGAGRGQHSAAGAGVTGCCSM